MPDKPFKPNRVHKPAGLGDSVAYVAHALGIDKLAELYTEVTGKDCGCEKRRKKLNELFPYGEP